jgi:hypothetical protein
MLYHVWHQSSHPSSRSLSMKPLKRHNLWNLVLGSVIFLSIIVAPHISQAQSSHSPTQEIQRAWQRASDMGAYRYSTTIAQTTHPLLKLENVGLGSTTERIYVEGDMDAAAHLMDLKLWADGGNTTSGENSIEVHVAHGEASGRVGNGEWQDIDDFDNLFAPGRDPLAYVAGARDVAKAGTETRAGVTFDRYTFRLDGPAFAAHMRDLLEAELRRKGELPTGLRLDMARVYVEMSGTGEIWLNSDGLPLRQILDVQFPPDARQRVEATITTDFFDFRDAATVGKNRGPLWRVLGGLTPPHVAQWGILGFCLALMAWLVSRRQSKKVYATIVVAVIASMLITPLLQSQQVAAWAQKQSAAQARAEQSQELAQQQQELATAMTTKDFDPQRDPLSVAVQQVARSDASTLTPRSLMATNSECDQLENDTGLDTDQDQLTDMQEVCLNAELGAGALFTDTLDSDDDGLIDGVEVFELGTNPTALDEDGDGVFDGLDSDGDGLNDGAEVAGFMDSRGQQWYLNPLDADTNGDGIPDTIECSATPDGALDTCPDTDGDATFDVFDFDDDGDGVPDNVDAARTLALGQIATGLDDGAFTFELQGLQTDTPAYVDFQLRPVNPGHLWYTLNVLDWPSEDREGQIQRVHDTTFDTSGQDANGDMRLIPMLEIEIPYQDGHYGHLPVKPGAPPITSTTPITAWLDTAQTARYNISVRKLKDDGTLAAYVPLVLVNDPVGDAPVAFAGRMFYRPSITQTGPAQTARLTWLIQAKTDVCITDDMPDTFTNPITPTLTVNKSDANAYEMWCHGTAHWSERETIVHTYYDDWYLTGFAVREDHGLEAGVVFEDPDYAIAQPGYDADTYYEAYLWGLAANLDETFIAGRANAADNRNLTLTHIENRFDKRVNGSVSDTRRWDIPAEVFYVETQTLADQSYITSIPMTWTQQILNGYFVDGDQAKIENPTLLFVREETFRAASLESLLPGTSGILDSNQISVSLTDAPETVQAGMNWAPYRYIGAGEWEAYAVEDYVSQLEERLRPLFKDDPEFNQDPHIMTGAEITANSFYLSLFVGVSNVVELDGAPLTLAYARSDADVSYTDGSGVGGSIAKFITQEIAKQMVKQERWAWLGKELITFSRASASAQSSGTQALKAIGQQASGTGGKFARFKSFKAQADRALVVAGALVGVAYTVIGMLNLESAVVNYVLQGISAALTVTAFVLTVVEFGQTLATQGWKALQGAIQSAAVVAAVVGLVVTAVVAAGFFIYGMISAGVQFASLAFNQAFANMVATIVVAALMLAISLIPLIGPLIVAIIGLIDTLIVSACMVVEAATDVEDENWWTLVDNYVCGGISGALTKLVEIFIYDQTPTIDLQAPNRMTPTNFQVDVGDLSKGMAVGNDLHIEADVITALYRNAPFEPDQWQREIDQLAEEGDFEAVQRLMDDFGLGVLYIWQFADPFLNDATFRYALVTTDTATLDVGIKQMESEWLPAAEGLLDSRRYTTTQHIDNDVNIPFTEAGLNWQPDLWLMENYAIQAQECVGIPPGVPPNVTPIPWAVCWLRPTEDAIPVYLGDDFKFDVFPATLDGFYTLASQGDGYALAWDERFPVLADADGDGLRSQAHSGNDPDDGYADSDLDGVSDFYEVQHAMSPNDPDPDGDGLDDYEEVRHGTHPALADTDGDGLTDDEEIAGWEFVYAFDGETPLITLVSSDPNDPDSDGDGITDKLEAVYGFNPRVFSVADILEIESVLDDDDGIVRPGATIAYTATIENHLRDRYAMGLLEVDFPAAVQNDSVAPQTFQLGPQQETALNGQVTVQPGLGQSQAVSLTNRAGAIIANLRGEAGGRVLWLGLNESAGATRFADNSLQENNGSCSGGACPTAGLSGYTGLAAEFDGVDDYIIMDHPAATAPITGPVTLAAWIKPATTDGTQDIVHAMLESPQRSMWLRIDDGEYHMGGWSASSGTTPIATFSIPPADVGQWVHLAGVYDGASWNLYRNGVHVASAAVDFPASVEAQWAVGAHSNGSHFFQGMIDQVEVYPRALSPAEIAAFIKEPIFHAEFDDAEYDCPEATWPLPGYCYLQDSSTAQNTIVCPQEKVEIIAGIWMYTGEPDATCPTLDANAHAGKSVNFNQSQYLDVSGSNLDLSQGEGHFTLAAWINPRSFNSYLDSDEKDDDLLEGWHGVFGRESSGQSRYPSLYIKGTQLAAGFGPPGEDWCGLQTASDVVQLGDWNHVLLTFDGTYLKLYVDGKLIDTSIDCAGKTPRSQTTWQIGRTDKQGYIYFDETLVVNEGDNTGDAEHRISYNDETPLLWAQNNIQNGSCEVAGICSCTTEGCYYDIDKKHRTTDAGRLMQYWENDCEDDGDPGDYIWDDQFEDCDELLVSTNGYSQRLGSYSYDWDEDGEGTLYLRFDNDFYKGRLDDVRLYRYAWSEYEVQDFYRGRRLELRLDESPGRSMFYDTSGNAFNGVCAAAANTCPGSGLPGRANQALRFDGVDDYVDLGLAPSVIGTAPFAVAAWVKTTSATGQVVIQQRDATAFDGEYQLRVKSDGNVYWWSYGEGQNGFQVTSAGALVNDGRWHHVVGVREKDGTGRIYIDGVERGSDSSQPPRSLVALNVYLGTDKRDDRFYFNGMLDHVVVINRELTAEGVLDLMHEAPVINMRLDEPAYATTFSDAANPDVVGSCVADPAQSTDCACPSTGADGWMRGAVVFDVPLDSSSDTQCISVPNASVPISFTVGGWFKPERYRGVPQVLVHKDDAYDLSIPINSMDVQFDIAQTASRAPTQPQDNPTSQDPLLPHQWNHVMATFDAGLLKIYVNGSRTFSGTISWSPTITNDAPISIGNGFTGMADEVVVYNKALSERDVEALYEYQVAWYDTSYSHDVLIDADAPTVALDFDGPFIPYKPGLVLAIEAHDQTSAVKKVEYRFNSSGAWLPAERDEDVWLLSVTVWSVPLMIDLRATDLAGNSFTTSRWLFVDGVGPEVSLDSGLTSGVIDARDAVHLSGAVVDALSGVRAVYVELLDAGGTLVGERQLADLDNGTWSVDYPLAYPPNGAYSVRLEAVDNVGNVTRNFAEAGAQRAAALAAEPPAVLLDGTGPHADLTNTSDGTFVLSGSGESRPVLSGTVSDVPYPTGQVLQMHFEEPDGATRFYDSAPGRRIAACEGATCPTASDAGLYGQALQFSGSQVLDLGQNLLLGSLPTGGSFSAMAWVRLDHTGGEQYILSPGATGGFGLGIQEGHARLTVGSTVYQTISPTLSAGQWTHVAAVMGETTVTLYVNGLAQPTAKIAAGEAPAGSWVVYLPLLLKGGSAVPPDYAWLIGHGLAGLLDEVVVYDRALTPAQVQAVAQPALSEIEGVWLGLQHLKDMDDPLGIDWQPVDLAPTWLGDLRGWSTQLPALEGPYRLHLRAADTLSHTRVFSSVWEGEVDTLAPRAELTHYAPRFPGDLDVYRCWVEDYNLVAQDYACPIPGSVPTYQDADWYTASLSQTKLYRYTAPAMLVSRASVSDTLSACDALGACTTVSRTTQSEAPWPLGVAIHAPASQGIFNTLAPIPLSGAAYAQDALLDSLTVTANGQTVYTQDDIGAHDLAWSTSWTPPGEGTYALLASVQDQNTDVITSSAPIAGLPGPSTVIYVDVTPPSIAITTTSLTEQNVFWNGLVRVEGRVTELTGMRRVEARLDSASQTGTWQEIPLNVTYPAQDAAWSALIHSGTIIVRDGHSYQLTLRVTDMGNHVVTTTQALTADLTARRRGGQ